MQKGKVKVSITQSCPALCNPCEAPLCPWDFPGQNSRVGYHSLLQGILPTQGWNPGLLHCGHILYHLNHQGIFMLKGRSAIMSGSLCCQNPKDCVNESHRLRMTTALLKKRGNEIAYPNLLLTKSFYQHDDKI